MASDRKARILGEIGRELKRDPPHVLSRTRRKKGAKAAERQRRAILLSKARDRGVRV